MAIDRLAAVPVAEDFFTRVEVVQIRPKTEVREKQTVLVHNSSGECGWVVDALAFTEEGVRAISWTV